MNTVPPSTHVHPEAPSPWVHRHAQQVESGGRVLDVACGGGRHVRLFAQRGHPVDAVDRNIGPGCATVAGSPAINWVQADIENGPWPFPGAQYAAVVVTNYLYRPLFPTLLASVASGGLLIYETFALGNERYGRPARPDFLLKPGELLESVRGILEVLAYENGYVDSPKAAIIQRIAARRPIISGAGP